jgi:hypothetical protein
MFGSGYENCPEFGVLGGVIFKLDILQTGRKITVLRERFRLHLPHIKMKHKNYHTVRTVPKSISNIVERDKIDTLNTQIHDCSLS